MGFLKPLFLYDVLSGQVHRNESYGWKVLGRILDLDGRSGGEHRARRAGHLLICALGLGGGSGVCHRAHRAGHHPTRA